MFVVFYRRGTIQHEPCCCMPSDRLCPQDCWELAEMLHRLPDLPTILAIVSRAGIQLPDHAEAHRICLLDHAAQVVRGATTVREIATDLREHTRDWREGRHTDHHIAARIHGILDQEHDDYSRLSRAEIDTGIEKFWAWASPSLRTYCEALVHSDTLQRASAAVDRGDAPQARSILDACLTPKSWRAWEWCYLNSRIEALEASDSAVKTERGSVGAAVSLPTSQSMLQKLRDELRKRHVEVTPNGEILVTVHASLSLTKRLGDVHQCYEGAWAVRGSTLVLAATRDGDLQAWDAVEGVMVARLHGRPNPGEDIVIAALSPDRSLLAAYEVGGVLNLWELPSGRLRSRTEDGWHSGTVAIEFSADGSRLLVSEFDDAWLLDASTGLQVASWAINCLNAWFTPRGSFVLVEEKRWLDSNTVKTHWRLCDAHTGLCKDTISDAGVILRCPEPPPDFQACATDCFDRDAFAFRYHDPRHGVVVLGARDINTRWLAAPPFHGPITAVAQNPGADRFAGAGEDGICIWDAESGAVLLTIAVGGGPRCELRFSACGTRLMCLVGADAEERIEVIDCIPSRVRLWEERLRAEGRSSDLGAGYMLEVRGELPPSGLTSPQ